MRGGIKSGRLVPEPAKIVDLRSGDVVFTRSKDNYLLRLIVSVDNIRMLNRAPGNPAQVKSSQ